MEVYPINKEQELLFHQIRHRIHRLQNGKGLDSMERIGADTKGQIGASYLSLKTLAKNYAPDLHLAYLLWGTKKREEQIVACFLFPKDTPIREKIIQLLKLCSHYEIAEYFGTLVLSERSDLSICIEEYLKLQNPYCIIAALTAIARNRIKQKNSTIFTKEYIQKIDIQHIDNVYVRLIYNRLYTVVLE